MPLLDLLCQLDSGDCYYRVVESLEAQHGPNSLLYPPMVLLHQIVQVLAGSNCDTTRKFAVCFHLPHRTVRSRIGVQRDLRGHASVLHRTDLAAFTSRFWLRKKSTVWPALSTARYRYTHCP